MSDNTVTREFELLTQIVIAEQNNYWMRFTAFSALTAALVVVAVSVKASQYVGYMGLTLSVCWFFVQWASYNYVVYYDRIWEPKIEDLGFRDANKGFWGGIARTTFVGALVATLSVVFWLAFILRPEWFAK